MFCFVIICSVVIDSYQVPRAAKAWPWLARHGRNVVIILQLVNNGEIQPIRIEIDFRSIVPIFLFSICCPFDLLSGHRVNDHFFFTKAVKCRGLEHE